MCCIGAGKMCSIPGTEANFPGERRLWLLYCPAGLDWSVEAHLCLFSSSSLSNDQGPYISVDSRRVLPFRQAWLEADCNTLGGGKTGYESKHQLRPGPADLHFSVGSWKLGGFMSDWSALMTPKKATLDSKHTLWWSVSYRRLSPQFQFSLSPAALDMYLYVNDNVFSRPAIPTFTRL